MTGDPKQTCRGDKAESEHRENTYHKGGHACQPPKLPYSAPGS